MYRQCRRLLERLATVFLTIGVMAGCNGGGGSDDGDATDPPKEVAEPLAVDSVSYEPFGRDADLIQFLYPSNWIYHSDDTEGYVAGYSSRLDDNNDRFRESFFVFQVSLSDFEAQEGIEDITIIEQREVTVSGIPGFEVIFDADVPDVPLDLRFMGTEVHRNGNAYVFIYAAERHIFPRYRDIVRHMTQSAAIGIKLANLDVRSTADYPQFPIARFDGENHFVFYCNSFREQDEYRGETDFSSLSVLLVTETGEILKNTSITPKRRGHCPELHFDVAFDGHQFVVVARLNEKPKGWYDKIFAIRVSRQAELIDTTPILVSHNSDNALNGRFPSIAYDGSNFLVVWQDESAYFLYEMGYESLDWGAGIFSAVLSPSGQVSNRQMVYGESGKYHVQPHIVYRNGGYDVVWLNAEYLDTGQVNHFYGRRVAANGDFSGSADSSPLTLQNIEGQLLGWSLHSNGSTGVLNVGVTVWHDFGQGETEAHNNTFHHYYSLEEMASNSINTTSHDLWYLQRDQRHAPAINTVDGQYRFTYYEGKAIIYRTYSPLDDALSPAATIGTRWTYKGFGGYFDGRPTVSIGVNDELIVFDASSTLQGWLKSSFESELTPL